jgi:hypothetical protein
VVKKNKQLNYYKGSKTLLLKAGWHKSGVAGFESSHKLIITIAIEIGVR